MDMYQGRSDEMAGFTLLQVCGAMTLITLVLGMGFAIYLSAKEVNDKTPVIEDAESVANSLNVFYLTHGVLPETFVKVTGAKAYDPWANFYIYDSLSPESQSILPMTKRAIFIRDQEGRVFADMDGDGTIDLSAADLDPDILLKLKDMSVKGPAYPKSAQSNRDN